MPNDGNDIVMFFEKVGGTALDAECNSQLDFTDTTGFIEGFKTGKYFEISQFNIGIKMEESDDSKGSGASKRPGKFGSWLWNEAQTGTSGSNQGDNVSNSPIKLDQVGFQRIFDRASVDLFDACCRKTPFSRVVALRRRDVGLGTGPQPYLRLEFTDVLLTKVTWQDGEQVKESCEFVCRAFKSIYRITDDAGNLTEFGAATWKFDKALVTKS